MSPKKKTNKRQKNTIDRRPIAGIPYASMAGHSTAQVAEMIGVSKNTLLSWLYKRLLDEPGRSKVFGVECRVWSESDIERARKLKGTLKSGPKPRKGRTL